jgi:phenylalanyl-tRNA synthetase beta chain
VRIVLSWLRELVPVQLGAEELGDLLAMKGAHPESIERPWAGLDGVIVARVLDVRDHPNSETLCLARVSTGSGEQEVVVGVRNFAPGDLVPLAAPGARVPSLPEPLGARKIRGVVSNGMLCSPRELGLSQDHGGILLLEGGPEPGDDLKRVLGLDEVVLDLEIESNRPDLLSVVGIAREVAGATGLPLSMPDASVDESSEDAATIATVEVKDAEGCPRYLARVIRGLGDATTPQRVQARLTAAGARPISPAVDATNYAMLELGQPLHAFDLRRLAGPGIVVRRAEPGERLTTLDDVERELVPEDLLICDADGSVAIAGVMGGATSEVGEETRDVLLESAYFEPRGILRTSRRLQLLTEASIRFSRGTDPEGVGPAASRAARLMTDWSGGGEVLAGTIDVGAPPARRSISVRPARASAVLGYDVSSADMVEALARLEVRAEPAGDEVRVEAPPFRPDLELEVDVVEEVARVQGYDRLPATLPRIRQPGSEQPSYALRRRVRELLVRAGLREANSLSFASASDLDLMGHGDAIPVANPPSGDQPFLRTSLLPNLARAAARNADRGIRGAALFEVGHVFRAVDGVREREHVAAALWGLAGEGLYADDRPFDVFDAKGAVESLLHGLGIDGWGIGDAAGPPFHPGRSAAIVAADAVVGTMGELHPRVAEAFGVTGRLAVFEFDVDALAPHVDATVAFRDAPRFPPVRRDLAFIVPRETAAGDVLDALTDAGGELLGRRTLFDVFEGGSLGEGEKSLAFSLEFRAPDRTLTDDEAEAAVAAIVARLARDFGARLRAG